MNDKQYMFSPITGETVEIEKWEYKKLFSYQIPLKKKPRTDCNKCYGRGYEKIDEYGFYHACSCILKCVVDGFDISNVKLFVFK